MGTGVALAFKRRYPDMFKDYQRACHVGSVRPGTLHVWKTLTGDWIINFPTKRDWRDPSRYEDVSAGLEALRSYLEKQGLVSVALPALGCGHGGLDWDRVSSMIRDKLGDLDAHIFVFQPADSHETGRVAQDPPSAEQLRGLGNLGFHVADLPNRGTTSTLPPSALVRGDAALLASSWIALLPSRAPGEAERAALQAIVRQVAAAPKPVTVAMVYATRATEDIADVILQEGVAVVLILPFGPLTKKKVSRFMSDPSRGRLAIISVAAPEAAWSRQLLAQSMTLLRDASSSVLLSDPNPEWLGGRIGHSWTGRPMFYLRYGSLSGKVCRIMKELGAQQITRRRDTGEPKLRSLFQASLTSEVGSTYEDAASNDRQSAR